MQCKTKRKRKNISALTIFQAIYKDINLLFVYLSLSPDHKVKNK